MATLPEIIGWIIGGATAGGAVVGFVLRNTATRWLAAIERIPSEAEMSDDRAARVQANNRLNAQGVVTQEHKFQIKALEDRANRSLTTAEEEHDRLSKHVVEISGDFEVLRSRVLILEIRMEQRKDEPPKKS